MYLENAHNTTRQTTGGDDSSAPSDNSGSGGLQGWMIAVIVIACVLFVCALVALFWLVRRLRRNRQHSSDLLQGKNGSSTQISSPISPAAPPFAGSLTNTSNDMSSIHSSTPIVLHGGSQRAPHSPITHSASSPKSMADYEKSSPSVAHIMQQQEARQSSSILSSTDAIMIADTFRQFMRKPEWNEHHDEEDEEVQNTFKSQQWSDDGKEDATTERRAARLKDSTRHDAH